jgi:hypothetical protein
MPARRVTHFVTRLTEKAPGDGRCQPLAVALGFGSGPPPAAERFRRHLTTGGASLLLASTAEAGETRG